MQKIGEASPGGAGRNRTLGIAKLEKIEVPVPSYIDQLRFGTLLKRMNTADAERRESVILLDAIIPSLLDRAFKGEL
jgi:type I restriction enzyme S subunit